MRRKKLGKSQSSQNTYSERNSYHSKHDFKASFNRVSHKINNNKIVKFLIGFLLIILSEKINELFNTNDKIVYVVSSSFLTILWIVYPYFQAEYKTKITLWVFIVLVFLTLGFSIYLLIPETHVKPIIGADTTVTQPKFPTFPKIQYQTLIDYFKREPSRDTTLSHFSFFRPYNLGDTIIDVGLKMILNMNSNTCILGIYVPNTKRSLELLEIISLQTPQKIVEGIKRDYRAQYGEGEKAKELEFMVYTNKVLIYSDYMLFESEKANIRTWFSKQKIIIEKFIGKIDALRADYNMAF